MFAAGADSGRASLRDDFAAMVVVKANWGGVRGGEERGERGGDEDEDEDENDEGAAASYLKEEAAAFQCRILTGVEAEELGRAMRAAAGLLVQRDEQIGGEDFFAEVTL